MNSITQEMRFRQFLMKYSEKYGVKRASRKYNKRRSYIYFWKARWDGTVESLAEQSKCPHRHPNEHTPYELKLIRDMRQRNPKIGLIIVPCALLVGLLLLNYIRARADKVRICHENRRAHRVSVFQGAYAPHLKRI